jgi:hypothetical protein
MPRIKITPVARVVLALLKFYLIFLFILIIVKFVKSVW